ncbi:MAG: hypothetical protein ACRCW4_00275 [Candidatus Neomicrothrix subdominans]
MIKRKPISTKITTSGTTVSNPVGNNIKAGKMSHRPSGGSKAPCMP